MELPFLEDFYLVGGTALALQIGHRTSIDLDLFSPKDFSIPKLVDALNAASFRLSNMSEHETMLISFIEGIKVDFVKMGYPIIFPTISTDGIRMLNIRDIAPMKLKAITQRGSKKDFYDLYFLMKLISLEEMLDLFNEKFAQFEVFHVVKSLTYFEDAEQYADPVVFDKQVTWALVKSEINQAVNELLR